MLTEDYAVFNKLGKGLIGTNNVDTNSRLCMSSAATAYKKTLGADAPPCSYEDIDHADCLFIAGSNAAWTHPVLFRRIEAAKARNAELRIVVVDPRRTVTAEAADLHLAIRPGTDVALFNAMLHVIVWEDLVAADFIRAHTNGFADAKAIVREFTPRGRGDLRRSRRRHRRGRAPVRALDAQRCRSGARGSTSRSRAPRRTRRSSTSSCDRADRSSGRGPFSLTGQPNAMGGRETGGMATLLPGHREIAERSASRRGRGDLGIAAAVAERRARPRSSCSTRRRDGAIDALWIACTNPAQSMPDLATVRRALQRTPFVVVQEAFATTETVAYADLLLPASTWGEKEGTVTNSERRISRVRPASRRRAKRARDWAIAADFARRLEPLARDAALRAFDYEDVEAVFDEHCRLTAGRDLDISGLDYAALERDGPQQWPYPAGATTGSRTSLRRRALPDRRRPRALRRHTVRAGCGPRRRALPVAHVDGASSRPVARHEPHRPRALAVRATHPSRAVHVATDIAHAGLADGEWALVASRRGTIAVPVEASDRATARPGVPADALGTRFAVRRR